MLYRIPHGPRDRRMLGWFLVGSPISVEFEVDLGRFTSDRLQTDGRLVRNIQIRYNQFELDFWLVSWIRPTTNSQAVGIESDVQNPTVNWPSPRWAESGHGCKLKIRL